MKHPIHRVTAYESVDLYTLRVWFEDETVQVIDFRPVLEGEIFGPLQDPELFRQVQIDPEAHTLVWPNGADFDPATLHDWPRFGKPLAELARKWRRGADGRSSAA